MPGPDPSDTDSEILRAVALHRHPFVTASDLEPELEVGYKQTRNRLNDLVEEGLLQTRMVGTTSVFWLTDEGRQALADAET